MITRRLLILINQWETGLLFNNLFLNNIKNIYQHAGKCDNQQKFKYILEADMVSTPEEITIDSPSLPMTQTIVKKPSASKSLRLFTKIFDVKIELLSVVLEIQNKNEKPLKLDVACVPKKKRKSHSKIN